MLSFSEYVTEEHIILFLCRTRAKIAKARGRKHLVHRLTTNPEFNYHKGIQRSANDDLNNLLPSRRKWKKLGEANDYFGKEYRDAMDLEFEKQI